MDAQSQRQKGRSGTLLALNMAIEALNLANEISCIAPAKAVFGSVIVLLTMIRDSIINKADYVEVGLACADICRALDRGMNGRRADQLSRLLEAIEQLTTAVAEIQKNIIELGKRNPISRLFHAKDDGDAIAAWRLELHQILHVFNTELAINTHIAVSEIHRTAVERQGGTNDNGSGLLTQTSLPGESPPSSPRACFGRSELIEKVVGLAENLTPTALIRSGGVGKTIIVLTVFHHPRIKE